MVSDEVTRRGFLEITGASIATAGLSGGGLGQVEVGGSDADDPAHHAVLVGPAGSRPPVDGDYLAQWDTFRFLYVATDGGVSYIDHTLGAWVGPVPMYPGLEVIDSVDDLPAASNGVHTLDSSTAYLFTDFVVSTAGLDPNGAALWGYHGSASGFIHTGGATALTGTDSAFFARELLFDAPGGTMFDLSANQSTEMLVESCSFADPAGLGNIASLGTISGYRVPSFKGCNFEDFDAGLTFDGTPDKIFLSGCPMRGVTASNVTLLTFAGTLDVDIVDMPDNYVKGVQSDTEVIRVETGGSPTDIFQYRGTTHDSSVTTSNILTGEASTGAVGYRVSNAYPLRDSSVVGELSLDTPTTTTISAQDTYTQVDGSTSLGNESTRVTQVSDGQLRYDGKKDANVQITVSATVEAPANETFAIAIAKNGTVEPTSEARGEGSGNAPVPIAPSGIEDLQSGDTLSVQVKNIDSASDITVDLYNMNFAGL